MTVNPYSPPHTDTEERPHKPEDRAQLESMANGQKMIIWAIISYFLLGALASVLGQAAGPLVGVVVMAGLAAILVLSLLGVLRLSRGLGVRMPFRILLTLLIFVPLCNLVMLAVLSGRATRVLRAAGYRVGLFGAFKPA
jgi:hypothetical protein